ncbi:glycoside hydrolase family 32 protein [Deinococcus roseus]|uniref:Levanase n=1 Tax=Deinococcus roseus TaxID=392414 RepID=A0ABQ2D5D7_9DEIO|nr:glycoside hydrolase family 32 protein [Deinococcus roseus]GGJ43550.1 hypothetical protein GCM10008938_32300 [Deinococcus roseus]
MIQETSVQALFQEQHRPQYHFSAAKNWLNDPNGLIFLNGEYHLFYQYNPHGTDWGNMSWGHAVSKDLIHWEELPVALQDDGETMVFSGSCVLDQENTSGFGSLENPPLVALYTGHQRSTEIQVQCLAYSLDQGRSWTRHGTVLDEQKTAFRDPKVFWHEACNCWVMLLALPEDHQIAFYHSDDLKNWTLQSHFGPTGHTGGIWEVPDLFELETEQGSTHWVLKVDVFPGGPHGGSGCQYWVGHFDGETFAPTQDARWVDHGKDFYAALSVANHPERTVWLGWMNNWQYARKLDFHAWNGQMSIPRSLSLKSGETGLELVQHPISELSQLRLSSQRLPSPTLQPHQEVLLHAQGHAALELHLEIQPQDTAEFGLNFRFCGFLEMQLGYQQDELFLRRNSAFPEEGFNGLHTAPLTLKNDPLKLRILLDWSSIEVFAEGGRVVFSEVLYPNCGPVSISCYSTRGTVQVLSGMVCELQSYR